MPVITPIGHFIRQVRIRDCIPSVAKPHPVIVKNHHKTTAEQIKCGQWTVGSVYVEYVEHGSNTDNSVCCARMSIR